MDDYIYIIYYSGRSNEGQHFFIRIYTSFYSFEKKVEASVVCETDEGGETRQIAILTHNFFS